MARLPDLSRLRPAGAPTGPYVDVLRDGESCPLSLEDFNPGHSMTLRGASRVQHKLGLRRAGEYQSRVGCDKAWRPLTYETEERMVDGRPVQVKTGRTVLEEQYYDTVQLGMWLLDKGISPATKREFVDEDRNACIAKAAELVESQGWASLMAYKESFFPSRPPPPPQALPNPFEAPLIASQALRQEIVADFMQIGKSTLHSLIYAPGSPLHYSKLLNLVHMSAGENGRVLTLSVATPGAVELQQGLQQAGLGSFGVPNPSLGTSKYLAVLYAAHEEYKTAHNIDVWANSTSWMGVRLMRPNQHWWDYWNHYLDDDVRDALTYRRSGREWFGPDRPGYGIGLRANIKYLCEHEVGKAKQLLAPFWPNMHAPPLARSWSYLYPAAQLGWTPELLVARSVLTLWALMAISPMVIASAPDPTTEGVPFFSEPMEDSFKKLPSEYVNDVLRNPELRLPRPESGA